MVVNGLACLSRTGCGRALVHWPELQITEKVALTSDPVANAKLVGNYMLVEKPAQVIAEGDRVHLRNELFGERPMQPFAQSNLVLRDRTRHDG